MNSETRLMIPDMNTGCSMVEINYNLVVDYYRPIYLGMKSGITNLEKNGGGNGRYEIGCGCLVS